VFALFRFLDDGPQPTMPEPTPQLSQNGDAQNGGNQPPQNGTTVQNGTATQNNGNQPPQNGTAAQNGTPRPQDCNCLAFYREEDTVVSIVQADVEYAQDITFAMIQSMVYEAVQMAGGLGSIVSDGDVVVLKPNLVGYSCNTLPGWRGHRLPAEANGNTTDYRITRAVAQMVRELNPSGRIYIIEGAAGFTTPVFNAMNYTLDHIPEVDGIYALELISGGWQERNSPYLIRIEPANPLFHQYYFFNRKIYEADVLINLPTLKNHWYTTTTGSIKNIAVGLTPANIYGATATNPWRGDARGRMPHGTIALDHFMVDYYMIRPADFIIMDALQGLSHGPTPAYNISGIRNFADAQKNMRSILASADSLAIDMVQAYIMNKDSDSVVYLQYFINLGLGAVSSTANIVVRGVQVDELRTDFPGRIGTHARPGRRLEEATPPYITIENAYFNGEFLYLNLSHSANTDKLDIFIDGMYLTSASANMNEIRLNLQGFCAGERTITVRAFDRRMHNATDSVVVNIDA
jgi:uncharacterized protein (DUF362 family)